MLESIEEIWNRVRNLGEYPRSLVTLTTSLGAIVIIFYTLKMIHKSIQMFRLYIFRQFCCSTTNFKEKYGKWAVVSGATDGIGLAMARELLRRGLSVIIIGRNEEKLANTKESLSKESNGGEILTVKIDLSDSSMENFDRIRSQIDPDNRDIGLLINNAGTATAILKRFTRFDMDSIRKMVNLNILATVHLTRMIMPGMLERGKGTILNVASGLGLMPAAYFSCYGATKAFIIMWSRQLQIEYKDRPVKIVCLTTGPVQTRALASVSDNFTKPTPLNPSPENYAKSVLNALPTGIGIFSGTLAHGAMSELARCMNNSCLMPIISNLNTKTHHSELSPVAKRKKPRPTNTSFESA